MGLLDGKVAIITGSGGGLGKAYALLFAKEGAKVVVNDPGCLRDGTGAGTQMADSVVDEIKKNGGIALANYDAVGTLASAESILKAAINNFGRVDILVNNAGILRDKTLLKMTEDMWDIVIQVHLKGTYTCGQTVAKYMSENKIEGRIINTTSIAGLKGNFGQTNYAAAKAGIYGLTLVWGMELKKYGITCNAIAPMAKTRMTEDIAVVPESLSPEMVAPFVLFLASDLAKDITGRIFGVHGTHIFEYKMEMTDGVKKEGIWKPAEILEKMDEISGKVAKKEEKKEDLTSEIDRVMACVPSTFIPEKAADWEAIFHFDIKGAGQYTLTVSKGQSKIERGLVGKPTNVVTSDSATYAGMLKGEIDGQKAFMEGKITATNIADMLKFRSAFDLKKIRSGEAKPVDLGGAPQVEKKVEVKEEKGEERVVEKPFGRSATGVWLGAIGRKYSGESVFAKPDMIKKYALATNDDNPNYLDENVCGGMVAPPIFPMRLFREAMFKSLTDREVGINLLRLVHGAQDMTFHRLVKPWDLFTPRAELFEIVQKGTSDILKIKIKGYVEGSLVVEGITEFFIRGMGSGEKKPPVEEKIDEERQIIFLMNMEVAKDQTYRYAEASGDNNPLHVDENTAKAAGFPTVILHGLCTLAFCSQAVIKQICSGNPHLLKRLGGRFRKPVFPLDRLKIQGWFLQREGEKSTLGFEVLNQNGVIVLDNGIAEVLVRL